VLMGQREGIGKEFQTLPGMFFHSDVPQHEKKTMKVLLVSNPSRDVFPF